jgi:hypothetical protein
MSPEERSARIKYLEGLGVPRHYHDAIIDAPTTKMMRYGGPALGLTLVALTIVVMVSAFLWLTNDVEARAADMAAQIGATLIYVNVGIGPLLLFFGLLFFTMWAFASRPGSTRCRGFAAPWQACSTRTLACRHARNYS